MELIALMLSMLLSGGYGQWPLSSLTRPCENMIEVQSVCSGPCEECQQCVERFFRECECLPMSFLEEHPTPDPVYACWYFWLYEWTEPICCEAYKNQIKRNGIPQASGESTNQFVGLRPDMADTNKRANGLTDNSTTSSSQDGINTSRFDLDNSPVTENNDNDVNQTDSLEEDLINVDITENDSGSDGSNADSETTTGDDGTDTETQSDNRTEKGGNKDKLKDKESDGPESTDRERNKRDSLLMRALMLTEELLQAEDLRKEIRHRDRFK